MDVERPNPPSPRAESTRLPHQPFQDAYEAYFRDLQSIWIDMQQRTQDVQLQLQSELQQAFQSQTQNDLLAAQNNYQRTIQTLYTNTAPAERYIEAYQKYTLALRDAVAGLNVDELDPQTLAVVGQHLLTVAQYATQLNLRPSSNANPFDARTGA